MKRNVLVIDKKYKEDFEFTDCDILSPLEFVLAPFERTPHRVFNISSAMGYQKMGYYASLLALARKDRVLPSPKTIQDIKDRKITSLINDELESMIDSKFKSLKSDNFELSVYMGTNLSHKYDPLCWELYRRINAPMFRVFFERSKTWALKRISILSYTELPPAHREHFRGVFQNYISTKKTFKKTGGPSLYDLAILVDPKEVSPPSDKKALEAFIDAFKKVGIKAELLEYKDRSYLGEYDALFIRETTNVNHHTFKLASQAQKEGLVVIDDPDSILKCTNKIFLEQLMERHNIKRPKTLIMDKQMFQEKYEAIELPCILKRPDSAFSQGVHKAKNIEELNQYAKELFAVTELILIQEFLPTDFDWRVGILGGEVLYVCKYYMAEGHWQIINNDKGAQEGDSEALEPSQVHPKVLETALRTTNAIGKGLYGVDLKQSGDDVYLIEVNDNPSLEYGVEDKLLGAELYNKIAEYFLSECNKRRGINAN